MSYAIRPARYKQNLPFTDIGHARERATGGGFTVVFYGSAIFGCKTAQFCATRRESDMAETPSFRNGVQAGENERKKPLLN
jgi:hypothetical protein